MVGQQIQCLNLLAEQKAKSMMEIYNYPYYSTLSKSHRYSKSRLCLPIARIMLHSYLLLCIEGGQIFWSQPKNLVLVS